MGTRSTITINDEEGKPLLCLYKKYDGYIEGGLGEDLVSFMRGRYVVDGYNLTDQNNNAFSGMSCLAAQVVAHLKDGIGNLYIQSLDDNYEGDYNYEISVGLMNDRNLSFRNAVDPDEYMERRGGKLSIKMVKYGEVVYDGPVDDFTLDKLVGRIPKTVSELQKKISKDKANLEGLGEKNE